MCLVDLLDGRQVFGALTLALSRPAGEGTRCVREDDSSLNVRTGQVSVMGFGRRFFVEASPRRWSACEVVCVLFEFRLRRRRQTVGPPAAPGWLTAVIARLLPSLEPVLSTPDERWKYCAGMR